MPRQPIDYQRTIIYKIVCRDLKVKELYVGHTTQFTQRKNEHRYGSDNKISLLYDTIRNNGGFANWDMVEVEKYACADKNEARARERHWYETLGAQLNSNRPICSPEELRVNSCKCAREYAAANAEKTKEDQKKYSKIVVVCECGEFVRKGSLSSHRRSQKHLSLLQQQNDTI